MWGVSFVRNTNDFALAATFEPRCIVLQDLPARHHNQQHMILDKRLHNHQQSLVGEVRPSLMSLIYTMQEQQVGNCGTNS